MGPKLILALGASFGIAISGHAPTALLTVPAQRAAPAPRFEVVSIEPLDPNHPPIPNAGSPFKPGGEYSNPNASVFSLLLQAYGVRAVRFDVHALPDWARTANYSIDAKPAEDFPSLPPADNAQQIRLMLRSLLADRFHAVVHEETRKAPVYEMTLARDTLKNATAGDASQGARGGEIAQADMVLLRGKNMTMNAFADVIGAILDRPVIDKTGLSGAYDFDVRMQAPEASGAQAAQGGCGPDCQGLVMGVLSNQLGLKLHASTAPIDFYVLDRVEKPGPN